MQFRISIERSKSCVGGAYTVPFSGVKEILCCFSVPLSQSLRGVRTRCSEISTLSFADERSLPPARLGEWGNQGVVDMEQRRCRLVVNSSLLPVFERAVLPCAVHTVAV